MTFWAILDTLLFKPLELLFEVIYTVAYRVIGNPGFTIIVLSHDDIWNKDNWTMAAENEVLPRKE